MDKETWQFINTFAPWLSAIGTLSAVVISLYLATKDRRIALRVDASLKTLIQTGARSQDFATISVVNVGRREATITGIGWKIGLIRKTNLFQVPGAPLYSTRLPSKLHDGESASYFMSVQPDPAGYDWVGETKKHLGKFPRLRVLTMKAQVFTSVGKTVEVRVDHSIHSLLTRAARATP